MFVVKIRIDSFSLSKSHLTVQVDSQYIFIFLLKICLYCVHTVLCQKEQRLVNYFFCLENILEPCTYSSSFRFSWSSTVLLSKFTFMEIDLWVLSNILASYLENYFTKIDIMKNWYLSHLLCVSYIFILCVCCALKVYFAFCCYENCEIQDLQLLFITNDKAFMEILLGQKFFPNISSWLFLKKRICIISADLCNPCIIMYEILYITLLWYVLQLLYFHLLCPDF